MTRCTICWSQILAGIVQVKAADMSEYGATGSHIVVGFRPSKGPPDSTWFLNLIVVAYLHPETLPTQAVRWREAFILSVVDL